ncbi:hypothetical protein ACFPOU_16865 [Massilia jejuensis]|uniref:Uncharacterized protein n=1 Tax=Massilia jejuensis TaxID=648894 RepID=A0ABW0PMR7_9BURK
MPGCAIREASDQTGWERELQSGLQLDLVKTDFQLRWITGLDILRQVNAFDAQPPVPRKSRSKR